MSEAQSLARSVYLLLRLALITTPWVAQLFVADICLSLLLPLSTIFPTLSYDLSSGIAESVWRGIQTIFTRANGASITISGPELPKGESAIVISNHVEWTDVYMIQALALRAGMLGRCRWFAKQQLKWVPFLGWGLWAMGMPLVSRNWTLDVKEMDRVFHGVLSEQWPIWLISYSEATRYTDAKHAQTVAWCKANEKAVPKHTLYPRTRGFIACVKQLRRSPHVKAIYDVTIAYARKHKFMAPPTFLETLMLPHLDQKWDFYVHVERHAIEELPMTDDELAKWLEDRWMEKGDRLEILRTRHERGQSWTDGEAAVNGVHHYKT